MSGRGLRSSPTSTMCLPVGLHAVLSASRGHTGARAPRMRNLSRVPSRNTRKEFRGSCRSPSPHPNDGGAIVLFGHSGDLSSCPFGCWLRPCSLFIACPRRMSNRTYAAMRMPQCARHLPCAALVPGALSDQISLCRRQGQEVATKSGHLGEHGAVAGALRLPQRRAE